MDSANLPALYSFFQQAQKLKGVLRHSWVGEPAKLESSAEHTWMLCLMAVSLFHYLPTEVDQLKTLKLLIIHDLAEAIAGDIPYFEEGARRDGKQAAERSALHEMTVGITAEACQEILDLWEEFEALATPEARVARAIDKYEALFSHAQADIGTWDDGDYKVAFAKDDDLFAYDGFIQELKKHIDRVIYEKLKAAGTLDRLDQEYLKRYIPA